MYRVYLFDYNDEKRVKNCDKKHFFVRQILHSLVSDRTRMFITRARKSTNQTKVTFVHGSTFIIFPEVYFPVRSPDVFILIALLKFQTQAKQSFVFLSKAFTQVYSVFDFIAKILCCFAT